MSFIDARFTKTLFMKLRMHIAGKDPLAQRNAT